jgi:hypothetical protein
MDGSDNKNKLIRQLLADLRKKLLDISPRNPLINFHFKDSSRTHIRVIDTLPDDLYKQLKNGKALTFFAIPKYEQVLSENPISSHSQSQLESTSLRLDDLLNTEKFQEPNKEQKTQQKSNTFRKTKQDNPSVIECAKQMVSTHHLNFRSGKESQ